MLIWMRTTINLPNSLAEAAKARAAAEGRTFTSSVEEGLRTVPESAADVPGRVDLPTCGDRSARFLVDPADRDALWAALDADGPR